MGATIIHLAVPADFRLKSTVLSHGWHECQPMSWSEGGRCFQIIERDRDDVYRVSALEDESARSQRRRLRVIIESGRADDEGVPAEVCEPILARLRITLGLNHDLTEFYKLCSTLPRLAIAPRIGAGRMIRSACMAENIVKAICGTNVNWTQAVKMINRIGQLGPHFRHFRSLTAWPTPREILRAGAPYLKEVCRLGYRTESILRFCRSVIEGQFEPAVLDRMAADSDVPSMDLVRVLRTVPGIGPSSAHYLVSFLGRHDCLSVDSATVAHVAAIHTNGRKPTIRQIERRYARYDRWKNLVCWLENWLGWDTALSIIQEAQLRGRAESSVGARLDR